MRTAQIIEELLRREKINLLRYERESKKYRTGTLVVRERNGKVYYSEKTNGKEKGITANPDRTIKVIRNNQLSANILESRRNIKILEDALKKMKKQSNSAKSELLAYSFQDRQWMEAEYKTNPFYKESFIYTTKSGTAVRSKSEFLIASALEELRIPYRYEQEMILQGQRIFPDFILRKADGSLIIWEHFGLMQDDEYAAHAAEKLELYRQDGYRQYEDLICTYEGDIKSIDDIRHIIENFVFF